MAQPELKTLSHPKYRPDVDGLRALAIISVLGFHAFPSLVPGGFIGVDIFFVISGYLISTIIFENLENQHFSYLEFYTRRIKRIFPALALMLLCTTALAWFILYPDEYVSFASYVMAGAGFLANFYAIVDAGNYFHATADAKPLLHLWTLGVEEQFYIVWPLLLGVVWRRKLNFLGFTFAIGLASFLYSIYLLGHEPTTNFYSPLTRFWELMTGGVLAYLAIHNPHYPNGTKNWCSIIGIILIILALIFLNKDSPFPGYTALLPTMGTFLLISAGPCAWLNRKLFSHRIAVWFGLISYPLYLWHWPILSFIFIDSYGIYDRKIYGLIKLTGLAVAILLSYLTYRFLELPIRKPRNKNKLIVSWLIASLTSVFIMGYCIVHFEGIPSRLSTNKDAFYWPEKNDFTKQCLEEYHLNGHESYWGGLKNYCLKSLEAKYPLTMVIGDSHSNSFYYGLQKDLKNSALIGGHGCPPIRNTYAYTKAHSSISDKELCPEVIGKAYKSLTKDTLNIFLVSRWNMFFNDDTPEQNPFTWGDINNNTQASESIIVNGLKRDITTLLKDGKNVFLVLQVPQLDFSPKKCLNIRPVDQIWKKPLIDCKIARADAEKQQSKFRKIAYEMQHDINNNKFVILDPWVVLCDSKYCYGKINNEILYRDENHLNMSGSSYLWPRLKAWYLKNKNLEITGKKFIQSYL